MERNFPEVKPIPTTLVPQLARSENFEPYNLADCPECGAEAYAYRNQYACRECEVGGELLSKKAKYGPGWEKVRNWILQRDNHQCQKCEAIFKPLEVHHKKKLIWFETAREANTPNNLITLCEDCHAEIEERAPAKPLNGDSPRGRI